ncbi:MAG: GtrA-like protein [Patescibacteria group bacterium]|nr:GtrA-like protein [Patescibacteria group bacterium]MDQ5968947.1 GtrA-like protein [Patescibacteria group bacterium]
MKRFTQHLIVRFVISGGTSAFVNIAILSLLYYVFHVYYLLASIISFLISFVVSLVLQKFWTFQDRSMVDAHVQAGKYLATSLVGLAINTVILYICVEHFHFYVFLGQLVAGGVTACCTFFLSRNYVFNSTQMALTQPLQPKP